MAGPEAGAQHPLFSELELGEPLPADVGRALATETRALLCKLLNNQPITPGALAQAAASEGTSMDLPVQVAQLVRKTPESSLPIATEGRCGKLLGAPA
jgi:hypothetical protein